VDFDAAFTTMLIRELGIYPPGSFVKLANDEIAVVLARRDKPSEPQVAALRKADGPAYAEVLLRETSHAAYKIISPCPPAWRVCAFPFWPGCGNTETPLLTRKRAT
jgi:hypothetical protein